MSTNEELIEEFVATRGLSKASYKSFKYTLKHYCNFQGCSLQELLDEADSEEEQQIRWKKRKLKKRLTDYMNFCKDTLTINTAKHYIKVVKIFYHHHDIEIHKLPPFNERNAKVRNPITPKDLPTREILQEAVEIAEPLMKALILFLVSSGMSKVDARNLTIQNFLDATSKYHNNSKDLKTAIKLMKEYDGEIITFYNESDEECCLVIDSVEYSNVVQVCIIFKDNEYYAYIQHGENPNFVRLDVDSIMEIDCFNSI